LRRLGDTLKLPDLFPGMDGLLDEIQIAVKFNRK
jgi:hypothetical protein